MKDDLVSCSTFICLNPLECLGVDKLFQGEVEKFTQVCGLLDSFLFMSLAIYSMLCSACNGPCDKPCTSTVIDSVDAAQSLRDCTIIEGNLDINIRRGSEYTL